MKKLSTKVLSLLLVVAMIFSTVVSASAAVTADKITADPATNIVQGYVTNDGNANGLNAGLLLDFLDEILKEEDLKFELDILGNKIKLDFTSVNGVLKTIDTVKGAAWLLKMGSLKKLTFKVTENKKTVFEWKEGQTRAKTGDYAILNNLISLIAYNGPVVSDVIDGSFTCGAIVDAAIKSIAGFDVSKIMEELLGSDLYTFIKQKLAGVVYEEGSAEYNKAVSKTVDNIIFEDLLTVGVDMGFKMADDAIRANWVDVESPVEAIAYLYNDLHFSFVGSLNGFKFDTTKSIDALIAAIANAVYENLRTPLNQMVAKYGEELNSLLAESGPFGEPFAALYDFSKLNAVPFTSKSVEDVNVFLGMLAEQISDFDWDNNANLGKNVQDMFMWAVQNRTKIEGDPYASLDGCTNFADYALALAKVIVSETVTADDKDVIVEKMNQCKNATEVITILLPYLLNKGDATIVSAKATTYEKVLGDIVGYYLNDYMPLYTNATNTKRYVVSSATSVWNVLNYACNYYLVDLNIDAVLGLSMTKTSTFFEKLDQLETVIFGTNLQCVKASEYVQGLIKNVLALDIEKLYQEGLVNPFIKMNADVNASEFAFRIINNIFTKVLGRTVFATSKFESIDKLVRNDAIGGTVEKILAGFNARKGDIIPVVLYWVISLSDKFQNTVSATSNKDVKVSFGGKDLKKDTDYTVTTAVATKGKTYNITVAGKGNFAGKTVLGPITCKHAYDAGKTTKKATTSANGTITYTCTLCSGTKTSAIAYPKTVTLKTTSTAYTGKAITNTVTVKDSAGKVIDAKYYTVSYKNNTNVGTATVTVTFKGNYSGTKTATFKILPAQVKGLKASKITSTSLTLTWTKVTGAKYYKVEQSLDGKKWTVVKDNVTTNTLAVSKLKANTKYQFRVTAKDTTKKLIGAASAVLKTGTATAAPKVTLKSAKKAQATASWGKVTGATKYVVYKSTDNKKWTKVTTTKNAKTTSYTLTKLSAGKVIYVKVAAVNAYGETSSSVVKVTVKK